MDLGLRIIDVAAILGTSEWTVILWEQQRNVPMVRFVPAIIRFLGYDPFPSGESPPGRLRTVRRRLGLSQAELAKRLGIDQGTLADFERGYRCATKRICAVFNAFERDEAPPGP